MYTVGVEFHLNKKFVDVGVLNIYFALRRFILWKKNLNDNEYKLMVMIVELTLHFYHIKRMGGVTVFHAFNYETIEQKSIPTFSNIILTQGKWMYGNEIQNCCTTIRC